MPNTFPGIFGPPGFSQKKRLPTAKQLLASDLARWQIEVDLREARTYRDAYRKAGSEQTGKLTIDPWSMHRSCTAIPI
jgi:hypothetical protein